MFRRNLGIVILSALLALTGCSKSKSTQKEETIAIPVNISSVQTGSVEEKLLFFGNITAEQEVKIYSTVPTRLTELRADVGDFVKNGQVLAVVDNEKIKQSVIQAEAGLEATRAQLANVETEYRRVEKLYSENAISKSQYDATRTQYEALKSNVKQLQAVLATAKNQLQDTYITAPLNGIITARNFNVGDQTSPQVPLFTVMAMQKVKVQIEVVESQVGLVKEGQRAYVYVNAYPERRFEGQISKVYPTVNPLVRTVTAELIIPNPEMLLKPGMYAKVEVIINSHHNVLVVPRYAVLEKTSLEYLGGEISNSRVKVNRYVYVVRDSLALMREVTTGIEDDSRIEILSGLQKGENIVTLGQHNLSDSALVTIIKRES